MEITSGHLHATRLFNCPEAFLKGARAEVGEEYGYCPDSTREQRSRIICAYLQMLEEMKGPIGVGFRTSLSKGANQGGYFS